MTDIDTVAEAIYRSRPRRIEWEDLSESGWKVEYLRMAQAAIDALQLTQEEQWVPVTESGDRWKPRGEGVAKQDKVKYPVGGQFADGDPWDGIAHLEVETRLTTPWVTDRKEA